MKTSSLHQHALVHFGSSFNFLPVTPSTFICCSFNKTTSYMLAPNLCVVPFFPPLMIWYLEIQLWLLWLDICCIIIDQSFICDTWTWFWLILLGSDQMIHYVLYISAILVYILDPLHTLYAEMLLFHWAWVCLPYTWAIFLISITGFLASWNLVKSSLVLARFFLCT